MEPQCCGEAVDNLYSAPGKKGEAGVGPSTWVPLWGLRPESENDRGGGWCLGRLGRTEEALLGEAGTRVLVPTEVGGISELTEACDWWSFGSLLYELLTGMVSGWAGCSALVGATECGMGQA